MRIPYVAAAEVPASIADELEDVDQSIRDASYRVRTELLTARFEVVNGEPVDEEVAQAIKDATIAQLRFWAETGDETGAGAQVGGGSILSVSLPGGGGSLSAAAKEEARTAPAVREILHAVDGITWNVGHY